MFKKIAGRGKWLHSRLFKEGEATTLVLFVGVTMVIGVVSLLMAQAQTSAVGVETETAQLSAPAQQVTDPTASAGKAVAFKTPPPVTPPPSGNCPNISGLTPSCSLKWSDEFNGSSLDGSKWAAFNKSNYGDSGDSTTDACLWARNVAVGGGSLQITSKKETTTCNGTNTDGSGSTYFWTSGFITTRAQVDGTQRYAFKHGYIETRFKMPRFNASWPSLWLVGDNNAPGWPAYGEIDVVELSSVVPDKVGADIHYSVNGAHQHVNPNVMNAATFMATGNLSGGNLGASVPPMRTGFINNWHTYGALWTPDVIRFFVDGKPWTELRKADYCTYFSATGAKANCFPRATVDFWNLPHTIHLGANVGGRGPLNNGYTGHGTSTGYIDGNLTMDSPNAVWEIDYVRVYQ